MRLIQKKEEPEEVKRWKKKFKNMHHRLPKYADIQDKEEKAILKDSLLSEQHYICCYCCNRIAAENSHIEHFKPKGLPVYEHLSLEYNNLHASCQGEEGDGKHCGHIKSNLFDEQLMISPLEEGCESRFKYTLRGEVYAADEKDEAAKYTIDLLVLRDKRLCAAREEAMWTSGVFTAKDKEEIEGLIERFGNPVNGKLAPFCDAILYQLKKGL